MFESPAFQNVPKLNRNNAMINLVLCLFAAAFSVLTPAKSVAATSQVAPCAKIRELQGASCDELTYQVDISQCPSKETAYVTKSCTNGQTSVRAQASDATYVFVLTQGSEGWGRKPWFVNETKTLPAEPFPKMKSSAANRAKISEPTTALMNEKIESQASPAKKGEVEAFSLAGVEINGYLDMYAQTNFVGHSPISGARYVGNRNGNIQINTAELNLKRKTGDVTFFADIGAGENENAFAGYIFAPGTNPPAETNSEITKFLPQAYLSYTPSEIPRLTISAGKKYTPFGLETPKAKENWLYTHSYSWSFAIPIWHEGVDASYEVIPEKLSGKIFVFNNWEGRIQQQPNRSLTSGFEVEGRPSEKTKLIYRNLVGAATANTSDLRQVHELVAQYIASAKWAMAFEGVYGTQTGTEVGRATWWGASVYGKYELLKHVALVGRLEHYDDSQGGFSIHGLTAAASDQATDRPKINSITFGANWDLSSGLETRLEYRYDASQDVFSGFVDAKNTLVKNQSTANVALLYGF